jgi:hypothetical protein
MLPSARVANGEPDSPDGLSQTEVSVELAMRMLLSRRLQDRITLIRERYERFPFHWQFLVGMNLFVAVFAILTAIGQVLGHIAALGPVAVVFDGAVASALPMWFGGHS